MVTTHTFVYTASSGARRTELFEFRNDAEAICCAKSLLDSQTLSVAIRSRRRRIGTWIWTGGAPEWKPGA